MYIEHTDRALRPTAVLGTSGLEGLGRLRPQLKLGAAPEIDRHTLQLSELCPTVATTLHVMNTNTASVSYPQTAEMSV